MKALRDFDFQAETIKIINENGFFLIALLRTQLAEGKDSQGKQVTVFGRPFYADRTVFNKERHGAGLGKQTDWITNYMSGAFYSQLQVITEGKAFRIDSAVPYFDEILSRSGRTIMELNKKNTQQFTKEILIPQLKARLKLRMGNSV